MTKLARLLLVLGAILLVAGVLSGIINRQLLDGPSFATHVDNIRKDDAVSRQAGILISDSVIEAAPNLVAVRPLVETTSSALVGSSAFGPVIRAMITPVHNVFTNENGGDVVLVLADVGAVLTAGLTTVAPEVAESLPADFDVKLATFGETGFASTAVGYAHWVRVLAWLLPLLGLLCFAGSWLIYRRVRPVAITLVSTGIVIGTLTFVGGLFITSISTESLGKAIAVAGWNEIRPSFWMAAGVLAGAGYIVLWADKLQLGGDPRETLSRAAHWLRTPPDTRKDRLTHGAVLLAVGGAAVVQPLTVLAAIGTVLGFLLALQGIAELVVAAIRRDESGQSIVPRMLKRPEVRTAAISGVALAVVIALLSWNAQPGEKEIVTIAASVDPRCNGHIELCDRPFNEIAFPATHNAMSAADEPGWFNAEQPTGLIGELDAGIRVLLFDTWPGQATSGGSLIANTAASRDKAYREVEKAYGPEVLESALRLQDAGNLTPVGPVDSYMCHGLCELGSTLLEPVLEDVREWLDEHPQDVVTFFIQDELTPKQTADAFDQAGLLDYVYTPESPSAPWPTLQEMIGAGTRLVVLAEHVGGGTKYPWYLQGFDYVQDTPFDSKKVSDFRCELLRGSADNQLLMINHWLNNAQRRVSDAATVNASDVLGPQLDRCRVERGQIPNFVAVNYFDRGDLFAEVDRLNGL